MEGLQYFDLGDALVRRLRKSSLCEIQKINLPRQFQDVDAVLPRQGIKSTASLRRLDARYLRDRLQIILRKTEHGDQADIHEILPVIVVIHCIVHIRRCHAKAGKKSDGQKAHHKQRQKSLFRMQDLADRIREKHVFIPVPGHTAVPFCLRFNGFFIENKVSY